MPLSLMALEFEAKMRQGIWAHGFETGVGFKIAWIDGPVSCLVRYFAPHEERFFTLRLWVQVSGGIKPWQVLETHLNNHLIAAMCASRKSRPPTHPYTLKHRPQDPKALKCT